MQDPTGSIGAAIHRSVLQHPQYQQGQMVPGTVLLLQQCSVFTPAPGTSYLAVTANNIIKVRLFTVCLPNSNHMPIPAYIIFVGKSIWAGYVGQGRSHGPAWLSCPDSARHAASNLHSPPYAASTSYLSLLNIELRDARAVYGVAGSMACTRADKCPAWLKLNASATCG